MRNIKTRIMKLEKKGGKGGLKVHMMILYEGDTEPEIKDPDMLRMIMRLDCPRPANS